jgi:hypothetical protein
MTTQAKLPKYPTNVEDCHKQLKRIRQEREDERGEKARLQYEIKRAEENELRAIRCGEDVVATLTKFRGGRKTIEALISLVKPKPQDYGNRTRAMMTPWGPIMSSLDGDERSEKTHSPFLTPEVWDAFVASKVNEVLDAFATVSDAKGWSDWMATRRAELGLKAAVANGQQQKEKTNG